MITCERELEDYICNNQGDFVDTLKKVLKIDIETTVEFIGRQVRLGNDNIIDLLYCFDKKIEEAENSYVKYYIVVELKFRELEPRDLAQISRYISILEEKILNYEIRTNIYGVFVSFGLNRDMIEISCSDILQDIYFLKIDNFICYNQEKYHKNEEYLEKIELDERIKKLYGESN